MKLKIIKGLNNIGKQILQISTSRTKIAVSFGEDKGTAEISEKVNPTIEGLTYGEPSYDAIFILRNPENCNLVDYALDSIPIYLEKKIKSAYKVYNDFMNIKTKENIRDILNSQPLMIKDIKLTYYLVDGSNANTSILVLEAYGKKVLISGDFKNFDLNFGSKKLNEIIYEIGKVDYWFIDGKHFGKIGPEYLSEQDSFKKIKNIMKFYKQVFFIQSENDLAITKKIYEVALKTNKIFIEDTFLSNMTTTLTGSAPNPVTSKKVYTYTPLVLDNKDFEFKKKYVTHFYIHNANNKMKKEKYVMNINTNMYQDIQVLKKEDVIYDACLILTINKQNIKIDSQLEEFLNLMKYFDMDYYELYIIGSVDYNLINKIISSIEPQNIIPLNFKPIDTVKINKIRNFKEEEEIEI